MQLKYGLISVDDHVQEPPNLWTDRLSKGRWGDRIPRLEPAANGSEHWVVDGQVLLGGRAGQAGALMPDRNREPSRWDEVPAAAYLPSERLKAMVDALGENEAGVFSICADVSNAEDVRRVRRFVRDQGMIVAGEVGALGMHR